MTCTKVEKDVNFPSIRIAGHEVVWDRTGDWLATVCYRRRGLGHDQPQAGAVIANGVGACSLYVGTYLLPKPEISL